MFWHFLVWWHHLDNPVLSRSLSRSLSACIFARRSHTEILTRWRRSWTCLFNIASLFEIEKRQKKWWDRRFSVWKQILCWHYKQKWTYAKWWMFSEIKGNSIQINANTVFEFHFPSFIVFDVQYCNIPPTLSLCVVQIVLEFILLRFGHIAQRSKCTKERRVSQPTNQPKKRESEWTYSHLENNAMQC